SGAEALPDEIPLFMFTQFHVAGYVLPMYHLRCWTVVLLGAFDATSFLEAVQRYRVTSAPMAPTMLAMMLENPALGDYDLSSLRSFGYGASSMPLEVLRRGFKVFPGVSFATGFGMTELAGNVMALSKQDHVRAAEKGLAIIGSVGKQMPLSRVRVLLDDNSDLTIVDRKKDMILTGGENVYPREVEEVLYEHECVLEAAVVGTPDPKWGESVVAVIALREGTNIRSSDLIAFCKDRIASYKKPKFVCYVPALPRNASGKVLKRELRERIASGELPLDAA